MELTDKILTTELVNAGYKVVEYPQDNLIELQFRGERVRLWCTTDESTKPKLINGTALQDNYVRNLYKETCQNAFENGAAWSNG